MYDIIMIETVVSAVIPVEVRSAKLFSALELLGRSQVDGNVVALFFDPAQMEGADVREKMKELGLTLVFDDANTEDTPQ